MIMGSGMLTPAKRSHGKQGHAWAKRHLSQWIMSDDPQRCPDFFRAHKVYLHYCSSDEIAGTRTTASAENFGWYCTYVRAARGV